MKCYYRTDDGPWIKGQITSMSGGTQISFCSRNESGVVDEIILNSHEVLFFGEKFSVTGYQQVKDDSGKIVNNILKLISVEVSGGWVKPKR